MHSQNPRCSPPLNARVFCNASCLRGERKDSYRTSFTVPSSQQGRGRGGRANKGALMKPGAFVRYYRIPPFIRAIESIPPLPRAIKRAEVSTISFHPLSDSVQTVWKGRKLAFSVPGGGRRREVSQTHIYITRCISSGTVDGVVSWLMSARTELRSIHHPSRNSNESKRYRDTANRCNPTTSRTMLPSDRLRIECNLTERERGGGRI